MSLKSAGIRERLLILEVKIGKFHGLLLNIWVLI